MRFTLGVILLIVGIAALAIPTFTYFTSENLANTRYFNLDYSKPHTIVINPIVGVISLAVGVVLILVSRGPRD